MTTVTFYSEGSRHVAFEIKGHSGYAEEGSDIVCASVTTAACIAECAINDVLGLQASVKLDPRNAGLSLKLPGKLPPQKDEICQTVLHAMMLVLTRLHEEYPDNITVLEV